MLILGMKPGHDGAVAVLDGRRLVLSLESEKDSYLRHKALTTETVLAVAQRLDAIPDVIALGGWKGAGSLDPRPIGGGYRGIDVRSTQSRRMFGKDITYFTSSHERSHLQMARGMAPAGGGASEAVLIWEGVIGSFVEVDRRTGGTRTIPVLDCPGIRYSLLYAVANPWVPDHAGGKAEYAGKLMALAAYGDPKAADPVVHEIVDRLLAPDLNMVKGEFADTPLHNAGVESEICKLAAAVLTQRIFRMFADVARRELPAGLPLRISGGCGLNCDWNSMWREDGHFESVFVPPCTNDSGSALGTAIDALDTLTGDPRIEWDVYQGLEFERDMEPDPAQWVRREADPHALAEVIGRGGVVAYVEGRWEIGPRALGHRSLLAEPFNASTRDRLNEIKKREGYRPIAPICRIEDTARAFHQDFADPYMLYFRTVRDPELQAVTHVDNSARAQTVTAASNPALHRLLSAFAEQRGIGVLCNTSLNFNGYGFINRMSDLVRYCDERGLDDIVVDGVWYARAGRAQSAEPRP